MTTKIASIFPDILWAGTDHSLEAAREMYSREMTAGPWDQPAQEDPEEEAAPWNYNAQGSVGVITVKGPLVNNDSEYNQYYGRTSYNDIRNALAYAAQDSVGAILMYFDSGGGAVSGCSDTSNLIKLVSDKVKPVYAFSDGTMASAAYWLGSAAKQVFCSDTAILGSIGVITSHMEYSKMYKEAGIGTKVLRAGEFKALANSLEPLTARAEQQIQEQLDSAYSVFINAVASNRNTTVPAADQSMGQGREFFGMKAVSAGLSDGVTTFDKIVSKIQASLDSSPEPSSNLSNSNLDTNPMKRALTHTEIAALASGAPLLAADKPPVAPEAVVETKPPVVAAVAPPSAEAPAKEDGVLAFVQGQLTASQTEVVNLRVALEGEKAKNAALQGAQAGLVAIAASSIKNMRVALRMPGTDCAGLSAESIVAEHLSMNAAFTKAFQTGGVAAPSDNETQADPAADANRLARVAATMGKKAN